ncbi:receptor-like protein Cf-9 homolog isoform X2 [Alnus glutinosa]|uniref:receptor-like protein Cf-9 homolog isoform X2 n=1 Tax=Alnus glutinosa TaxID=3517 RepID=UPI002D76D6BF|nr:receptor-like protein Cf-9 homolog isoform X2 [Alnus glutinosa]
MGLPLSLFIFMPFLFVLSLLHLVLTHSSPFLQPLCHHDDSSALLQFKESLVINKSASPFVPPYCEKNVASWTVEGDKNDCCSWDGVECNEDTGHVIGLNLSNSCLQGSINSNSSLFRLVHLQSLNLSYNHFNGSHIPSQVRDLSKLIDLDLHRSHFVGQIPLEISQLSHLSSLDLSYNYMYSFDLLIKLELKEPILRSLVANLTSLQKLDLSYVNMSSTVPNILANLSSLTHLGLSRCGFSGQIPSEISQLSHLLSLDLSYNYMYSFDHQITLELKEPILRSLVTNLTSLQKLDLSYVNMSSTVPNILANLSSLTHLGLSRCGFSGQIPSEISQLSHLSSLDLSYNYMYSFDHQITLELKEPILRSLVANLTSLQKLDLSEVNMSSTVPNILANLSSLTSLILGDCGLYGEFPKGIFKLPNLQHLDVNDNEGLTGYLPDFTWSSPLETLDVGYTSFSGELPASTGNFSFLTSLSMPGCNFSRSIPSSLGNLTKLTHLYLSFNYFVGNIPHSLGNLVELSSLDISYNQLTGPFPLILGNLVQLFYLSISHNQLTGPVPLILGNLVQLSSLDISHNQLTGPVPFEVLNLPQLLFVDLSYNLLHGEMHHELMNGKRLEILILNNNRLSGPILTFGLTTLQYLDLSNNLFTSFGQQPTFLPWTHLQFLDLTSNSLQGSLPILPISTSHFFISNNSLTGNIQESFCNLSSLEVLDLASNNLSGSLPRCLDNFGAFLSVLDLQRNKFQGSIPKTWIRGGQLEIINLSQNKFQGNLLRSLAKCTMLKVLDLSNNEFNDRFPSWLENLPNLQVLNLRSNKFHGPIRTSKSEYMFPKLRIIDLSHNNFVGKLPLKLFGNCNAKTSETANYLTYIHVYSMTAYSTYEYDYSMTVTNKGEIMFYEKVQELLMVVDISRNRFVGSLTELQALDLSQNMLSGEIPQQLTQLTFLEFFNVSHNMLTGLIPRGKQFDTFQNNSFEGNPGLCGIPLTKKCENSDEMPSQPSISQESHDSKSLFEFGWKIVAIGYGFGFVVGVIIGHIVIARKHNWLMKTFRIRPLSRRRR